MRGLTLTTKEQTRIKEASGGVWVDDTKSASVGGSREQGQEARDHHVPADTREGEVESGPGGPAVRLIPHAHSAESQG